MQRRPMFWRRQTLNNTIRQMHSANARSREIDECRFIVLPLSPLPLGGTAERHRKSRRSALIKIIPHAPLPTTLRHTKN